MWDRRLPLLFLFLILFILLFSYTVSAAEDEALLIGEVDGTKVILDGEQVIEVRVIYGYDDCTDLTIRCESDLFQYDLPFPQPGPTIAGASSDIVIDIDPEAHFGDYDATISISYHNGEGVLIKKAFPKKIVYSRSLEVFDVKVPTNEDRTFRLDVETFTDFSRIDIVFDTDGDLGVTEREVNITDVKKGIYTISTEVFRDERSDRISQEIRYSIYVTFDDRYVQITEDDFKVYIDWSENPNSEGTENNTFYPYLVVLFIVLLILVNYFLYFKRKR